MQTEIKKLPKGLIELSITVDAAELRPHLEAAAQALAQTSKLEGFRPGKAPYELVAARVGEGKIYEVAAEAAVRKTYPAAARARDIKSVGEPEIAIKLLAPGNPFAYAATVPVLPAVTRLADYRAIKVEPRPVAAGDADLDRVLRDLRKMQTRETEVERAAATSDKVVVNVTMSRDNVPIEGGAARGHQVYLAEPYYIPGFTAELAGLKKGDTKKFSLAFPAEHFQKHLAGKTVDFDVSVVSVSELAPPAFDNAFAAALGQKNMDGLRGLIQKNIAEEGAQKERQRQEIAVLEKLIADSQFDDIPEVMLNNESERMVDELSAEVSRQGMVFADYLTSIKKTRAEVALGFAAQAVRRIKTALVVQEVGAREGLEPSEADVEDEINRQLSGYSTDAEAQNQIRSPEYADATRSLLRNRLVVEFLRGLATGS